MEYTSKAVGNAALTTGIIGTTLGALSSAGGLAGILGLGRGTASSDPGDRPVTRYELGLIQENNALKDEIVAYKANQYTDAKANALQAQISEQAVFNATAIGTMNSLGQQVAALQSITRVFIPNENVAPGWGRVYVAPVPPFPPTPPTPGTSVSNGTADATTSG